jgi:hypothetical protein
MRRIAIVSNAGLCNGKMPGIATIKAQCTEMAVPGGDLYGYGHTQ